MCSSTRKIDSSRTYGPRSYWYTHVTRPVPVPVRREHTVTNWPEGTLVNTVWSLVHDVFVRWKNFQWWPQTTVTGGEAPGGASLVQIHKNKTFTRGFELHFTVSKTWMEWLRTSLRRERGPQDFGSCIFFISVWRIDGVFKNDRMNYEHPGGRWGGRGQNTDRTVVHHNTHTQTHTHTLWIHTQE